MTRDERRQANRAAAEWARGQGVTPSGRAWDAMRAGCQDVAMLRSLNLTDGCLARRMPDGARPASTLRDGDILTGSGRVTGAPVIDPDTRSLWVQVTREDGTVADLDIMPATPVHYARPRPAGWMSAAGAAYRDAVDAWQAGRESGRPAPTSVPGVAGSDASCMQLTDEEYAAAFPKPDWRAFVREYVAGLTPENA